MSIHIWYHRWCHRKPYAYDAADRLTAITPASGASATFTFDALGRLRTRVLSGRHRHDPGGSLA